MTKIKNYLLSNQIKLIIIFTTLFILLFSKVVFATGGDITKLPQAAADSFLWFDNSTSPENKPWVDFYTAWGNYLKPQSSVILSLFGWIGSILISLGTLITNVASYLFTLTLGMFDYISPITLNGNDWTGVFGFIKGLSLVLLVTATTLFAVSSMFKTKLSQFKDIIQNVFIIIALTTFAPAMISTTGKLLQDFSNSMVNSKSISSSMLAVNGNGDQGVTTSLGNTIVLQNTTNVQQLAIQGFTRVGNGTYSNLLVNGQVKLDANENLWLWKHNLPDGKSTINDSDFNKYISPYLYAGIDIDVATSGNENSTGDGSGQTANVKYALTHAVSSGGVSKLGKDFGLIPRTYGAVRFDTLTLLGTLLILSMLFLVVGFKIVFNAVQLLFATIAMPMASIVDLNRGEAVKKYVASVTSIFLALFYDVVGLAISTKLISLTGPIVDGMISSANINLPGVDIVGKLLVMTAIVASVIAGNNYVESLTGINGGANDIWNNMIAGGIAAKGIKAVGQGASRASKAISSGIGKATGNLQRHEENGRFDDKNGLSKAITKVGAATGILDKKDEVAQGYSDRTQSISDNQNKQADRFESKANVAQNSGNINKANSYKAKANTLRQRASNPTTTQKAKAGVKSVIGTTTRVGVGKNVERKFDTSRIANQNAPSFKQRRNEAATEVLRNTGQDYNSKTNKGDSDRISKLRQSEEINED